MLPVLSTFLGLFPLMVTIPILCPSWSVATKNVTTIHSKYKNVYTMYCCQWFCVQQAKFGLHATYLSKNAGNPSNDHLHARTIVQVPFTAPFPKEMPRPHIARCPSTNLHCLCQLLWLGSVHSCWSCRAKGRLYAKLDIGVGVTGGYTGLCDPLCWFWSQWVGGRSFKLFFCWCFNKEWVHDYFVIIPVTLLWVFLL